MATVDDLTVTAATIPTDAPESDRTLHWDPTTIVLVELRAGGTTGIGWTYGDGTVADVIAGKLRDNVVGTDALDIQRIWLANERAVRNNGRSACRSRSSPGGSATPCRSTAPAGSAATATISCVSRWAATSSSGSAGEDQGRA
jgi:hypothetical protein